MNFNVLKMLYFAFVHPHILYCVELYANTFSSYLSKLNSLNNKILRVLQNQNRSTNSIYLYKKFNTLPITKLHQFQLLCLIHKFLYNRSCLPLVFNNYFIQNNSIHNYNTRNKHNLHLSSVHSEYGKRSIKFKASNLWNKLPENLKNITSLPAFKKSLRIFLLNADI